MDDPLIGLTFYNNSQTGAGPDRSPSTENGSYGANGEDGGIVNCQSKELWKVGVDDGSKDCFPCLPGISEDQQNDNFKAANGSLPVSNEKEADPSHSKEDKTQSELNNQTLSHPKNFWLMRLFQSNLFTMSIGISYLFNSKDPEVLSYLGGRLYVSQRSAAEMTFYTCYTLWLLKMLSSSLLSQPLTHF